MNDVRLKSQLRQTIGRGLSLPVNQNGRFKFGRIPQIAFTPLLNPTGTEYFSQVV